MTGQMAPPPTKKSRTGANAEDLEEGTHVLYWGGCKGVIRDAYIPLDEFWVTDSETGQIVKDDFGKIVQFKSEQLQLAPQEDVPSLPEGIARSAALVVGREEHMMKVLEHFGEPDTEERRSPQQLLAIPCHMCSDLSGVSEGVTDEVVALARKFRPDLHVGVRSLQIQQAVDKIGADLLRMEGYYCLVAVQMPFSQEAMDTAGLTEWEKHQRKNICNQIDLCPTASTEHSSAEKSEAAARLALGETCGIEVSDLLWEEKVQLGLRRRLEVDLACHITAADGSNVSVVLLPDDAVATKIHGVLCFSEAPGADYEGKKAAEDDSKAANGQEAMFQGKTVRQWEEEQAQYANLPKLPAGWLRVKSRKTGEVYYFNKRTQESTFDLPEGGPLPPNWTKQVSKSTGKVYYFNMKTKESSFDRPAA